MKLTDGNYVGVIVSDNGNTILLAPASVSDNALNNVPSGTLKGRTSNGTGAPENIPFAQVKAALGLSKTDVGLANVENTADAQKPVSIAQQAALDLKANAANPVFTGTVSGVTKIHVGLSNVDNTSDMDKPVSAAVQAALAGKVDAASAVFTGSVSGLDRTHVGLNNVDNTADAAKPVSAAQQAALDLKANAANPVFTGTVSGVTKAHVNLGNVDNTADLQKPISLAQQAALNLKADAANPVFTGTVSGVTKAHVNLGNVDNTADMDKPISSAVQLALDSKQDQLIPGPGISINPSTNVISSSGGSGGVTTGSKGPITVVNEDEWTLNPNVVSPANLTQVNAGSILGRSTAGVGNVEVMTASQAKTALALTKADVGLSSVDNTSDTLKPVSVAQQLALDQKANSANPVFTGTVSGVTKTHVGLSNVDNTADSAKPVSAAVQAALNLKQDLLTPGPGISINAGMVSSTIVADGNKGALTVSSGGSVYTMNAQAVDNVHLVNMPAGTIKANLTGAATTPADATLASVKAALVLTKADVGLSVADNTSDSAKPVSIAQQAALDLKANAANPVFTGTVSGVTKAHVNLGNVDNTADAAKPVSGPQQVALDLKQNNLVEGPGIILSGGNLISWSPSILDGTRGDLTISGGSNTFTVRNGVIDNNKRAQVASGTFSARASAGVGAPEDLTVVQAKALLAYTKADVGLGNVDNTADSAKPVSAPQQAALDLKANAANPVFTGTVSGVTKAHVSLGNVDNTSDLDKPLSLASAAALALKADAANPVFTGTVSGVTKVHVGLGNVDNTADSAKPVSALQQAALNLKQDALTPGTGITINSGVISAIPNTTIPWIANPALAPYNADVTGAVNADTAVAAASAYATTNKCLFQPSAGTYLIGKTTFSARVAVGAAGGVGSVLFKCDHSTVTSPGSIVRFGTDYLVNGYLKTQARVENLMIDGNRSAAVHAHQVDGVSSSALVNGDGSRGYAATNTHLFSIKGHGFVSVGHDGVVHRNTSTADCAGYGYHITSTTNSHYSGIQSIDDLQGSLYILNSKNITVNGFTFKVPKNTELPSSPNQWVFAGTHCVVIENSAGITLANGIIEGSMIFRGPNETVGDPARHMDHLVTLDNVHFQVSLGTEQGSQGADYEAHLIVENGGEVILNNTSFGFDLTTSIPATLDRTSTPDFLIKLASSTGTITGSNVGRITVNSVQWLHKKEVSALGAGVAGQPAPAFKKRPIPSGMMGAFRFVGPRPGSVELRPTQAGGYSDAILADGTEVDVLFYPLIYTMMDDSTKALDDGVSTFFLPDYSAQPAPAGHSWYVIKE